MLLLGIETSCDDTAAAIVRDGKTVLAGVATNQDAFHARFGGIVPEIEPPQRFPVRFYLVAMIFIIFDIEIVFMYPFAVVFKELGNFGLVEVVLVSVVVFVSLLFLVSSGALTWGPVKRLTRGVPSRTSESTIARITADPAPDRAA